MKKVVITLLAVMLVSGAVYASDKPALEKPLMPVNVNLDIFENEPNDDCASADYITLDDNYGSAIDPAGDVDWYEVFFPAGGEVAFETLPGDVGDTKMYLYADDCVTELAYNDDIGYPNYYSKIEYTLEPNTTYYVLVTGYSATTAGTYFLTMTGGTPPPEPPVNNTCEGALLLPYGTFTFDNTGATDDYSPTNSDCTGYTAHGVDVVYYIDLVENQQLEVTGESTYDTSIYMVTDCNDVDGTCVAGSDNYGEPEYFIFDAAQNPGRYYVIFDGYSSTGFEGTWSAVTPDGVVDTEGTSWDGLKSLYR
jgi:hypothetical protein